MAQLPGSQFGLHLFPPNAIVAVAAAAPRPAGFPPPQCTPTHPAGKTTVSKLLSSRHGLPIIDADVLARDVIAPGTSGYRQVVQHFGPDRVLMADGVSLDRAAIGDIIFRNPDERKWLNGVVHPRVKNEMVRAVLRAWITGEWCVVVDVPLLIEAGLWKWVGEVVVVYM